MAFESRRVAKFHLLQVSTACGPGYLLGNAMDITPAQQYLAGGNTDNLAGGKQALQGARSSGIPAFIVQRHDDAGVGNVKIDVRGG